MAIRRKWLGAAAVAAAVVGGQMTVASSAAFDAAAWKAEAGNRKSDNPRGAMAEDVEKELRAGMSRSEVEALLGRPDEFYRLHIYGAPASGKALHGKAVKFGVDGKVIPGANNIARDVSGAGMTAKQVAAVIGEPTEIRDDYVYNLGSSPYGVDRAFLHAEFDAEGKLVRYFKEQG